MDYPWGMFDHGCSFMLVNYVLQVKKWLQVLGLHRRGPHVNYSNMLQVEKTIKVYKF